MKNDEVLTDYLQDFFGSSVATASTSTRDQKNILDKLSLSTMAKDACSRQQAVTQPFVNTMESSIFGVIRIPSIPINYQFEQIPRSKSFTRILDPFQCFLGHNPVAASSILLITLFDSLRLVAQIDFPKLKLTLLDKCHDLVTELLLRKQWSVEQLRVNGG